MRGVHTSSAEILGFGKKERGEQHCSFGCIHGNAKVMAVGSPSGSGCYRTACDGTGCASLRVCDMW